MFKAIYDLNNSPNSFDFVFYLAILSMYSHARRIDAVHLEIVGAQRRVHKNELEVSKDDDIFKRYNVLLQSIHLFRHRITSHTLNYLSTSPISFPPGYSESTILSPTQSGLSQMPHTANSLRRLYENVKLHPGTYMRSSQRALNYIRALYGKGYITITVRWSPHNSSRNPDLSALAQGLRDLKKRFPRTKFIIVPDQDDLVNERKFEGEFDCEFCEVAAFCLDIRLALYEQAITNISWATGPAAILIIGRAPHIIFGTLNSMNGTSNLNFLERKGPSFGSQSPWSSPYQEVDWIDGSALTTHDFVEKTSQHVSRVMQIAV
jgi:hypothetical protein